MTSSPMQRYCFQLQLKPGHLDQYRAAHAAVWPEMLDALAATGWHNYSIFVRPDGLVIGYFESADLAASLAGMAATEVNARWQDAMSEHFAELDVPADQGMVLLDEVFNLESQLDALGSHN